MGTVKRENWSGKFGFILAVAGSAIGLGNIWKFPYITGENGGGAFVLVYLGCILFCGMPIMLCEFAIGRHTKKNPCAAFRELEFGRSPMSWFLALLLLGGAICSFFTGKAALGVISLGAAFAIFRFGFSAVGFFTIMAAMLILSYYSVIGGWIMQYVVLAFSGKLAVTDLESARSVFVDFVSTPRAVITWHLIFLAVTAAMLWGGIRNGIEKWSKILMPLLFILLVTVILRSLTLPGAEKGVEFFLSPDFSKLSGNGILEALGHSFYTLSLGMAISITYGSYLAKDQNLFFAAGWVIVVDTAAAMLAGLAIFPAVFAMGFAPNAGPQLIFEVLPSTFNRIPGGFGHIWAGFFFLMLAIAALTSAASLLECGVTFLVDEFKLPRKPCIVMSYLGVGLFGMLSAAGITGWDNIPLVKSTLG
ncbi:MAG: sodium-dependent transporter, partial [Victivallaceae bacterium]|nr:sodium-dependent transporter [Victivallaceae bacterium]